MAKCPIEPIAGERVRLRLLAAPDLPLTLGWRNRAELRQWFFHSEQISLADHLAWFERYCERPDDYVFMIEQQPSLRAIGQIALYHIDWSARRAEMGRLMIGCADAAGHGFATAATRLLVGEAHHHWGIDELYLEVYAHNLRAQAVYRNCGFVSSGRRADIIRMHRRRADAAGDPR